MTLRLEFVELASQEMANVRELCRRFGISPKTGYKWLGRYDRSGGDASALLDCSRRPVRCDQRTPPELEQAVVQLRQEHPRWGGRKIARRLLDLQQGVIAPSTVSSILRRRGLITPDASEQAAPIHRFEHEQPNAMWQMDFKGYFKTLQGPCYPLTVLDDHSRFNLALLANARTTGAHIQAQLVTVFNLYGLPARINVDNGPPWGGASALEHGLTELTVWMIRLGIWVTHSRPFHPQTNGKVERFHRSLQDEVISRKHYVNLEQVQQDFDRWRRIYNLIRPHEALQMEVPVSRYQPSPFPMPSALPQIVYRSDDIVARVSSSGRIRFKGRTSSVSRALAGLDIAIRADSDVDGCFHMYFCHQKFATLDLANEPVDT